MMTNSLGSGLLLGSIPFALRSGGLQSRHGGLPISDTQSSGIDAPGIETLASLFDCTTAKEFIHDMWTKNFRYFPGECGRYRRLLSWDDLNRILDLRTGLASHLQLAQDGRMLPLEEFAVTRCPGRIVSDPVISHVKLNSALRNGATLIINEIHELHPPIGALAGDLEDLFHVPVQVNLYASWSSSPGFGVHWDGHEVLVLQIAGRKQWQIYGKTEDFPLQADRNVQRQAPQHPIWEQLLTDGDGLYIPRGWWHAATPLSEPTLHLTVGIGNRTGVDLLAWFIERLRTNVDVRRDLPLFEPAESRRAYMERLGRLIQTSWSIDLLQEYLFHCDATALVRSSSNLPWSATEEVLPTDCNSFTLKWIPSHSILHSEADRTFSVACNGARWLFAAEAHSVVERLVQKEECTVKELCSLGALGGTARSTVIAFVRELAVSGLVGVAPNVAGASCITA
jgi:Cupin superfamily protein